MYDLPFHVNGKAHLPPPVVLHSEAASISLGKASRGNIEVVKRARKENLMLLVSVSAKSTSSFPHHQSGWFL